MGLLFLTPALSPKPRGTSFRSRPHDGWTDGGRGALLHPFKPHGCYLHGWARPHGRILRGVHIAPPSLQAAWGIFLFQTTLVLNPDQELPTGPHTQHYGSGSHIDLLPGWQQSFPAGKTCHSYAKYLKYSSNFPSHIQGLWGNMLYSGILLLCTPFLLY